MNNCTLLNNDELKSTYLKCKTMISKEIPSTNDSSLLKTYNFVFEKEDGFLHYSMVKELYEVLVYEMAERYSNQ